MKAPVVYRPMTELELKRARALDACSFMPGCWDKRFVRSMRASEITEKQAAWLVYLTWRYRRQIPADLVPVSKVEKPA